MQQKAINLRPRYFKLMVTGICTRLIVTFILAVSKEIRKEKLVVIPDLGEEGNLMLVVGIHATQEGPLGAIGHALTSLVNQHMQLFSLNILKTIFLRSMKFS